MLVILACSLYAGGCLCPCLPPWYLPGTFDAVGRVIAADNAPAPAAALNFLASILLPSLAVPENGYRVRFG